jgi:hypothetical protein
MNRLKAQLQRLDQRRQAGRLANRQLEDQTRQRSRVDDRVLQRRSQAATDEPRVEGVVAVLHQHRSARELQERVARVGELGGPDQHVLGDAVPARGVRVDRSAAVDERVEEAQGTRQLEPFGAYLEDEERTVAGRLGVQGHEVRFVE